MESYFEALAPYGCNGYKEPVFLQIHMLIYT